MMTLKDLRKVNIATKTFYTLNKLDGDAEYISYDYLDEDENFSIAHKKITEWEKRKNIRVKYITHNNIGDFLSVTLEEYEPRKKRS